MFGMIMAWVMLSTAIVFGIMAWRKLSGNQQWQLTKLMAYATMCSVMAVMLLVGIVLIF